MLSGRASTLKLDDSALGDAGVFRFAFRDREGRACFNGDRESEEVAAVEGECQHPTHYLLPVQQSLSHSTLAEPRTSLNSDS